MLKIMKWGDFITENKAKDITARQAMDMLGMSKSIFYRWVSAPK